MARTPYDDFQMQNLILNTGLGSCQLISIYMSTQVYGLGTPFQVLDRQVMQVTTTTVDNSIAIVRRLHRYRIRCVACGLS